MKSFLTLLFISVAAFVNAQIGAKVQQQSTLVGAWQNSDMGFQMVLLLNPDGTGEFDGEMIRYSTQGNQLLVSQQGITNKYNYTIQGAKLTLSGGDLDSPLSFTRVGSNESQPAPVTTTAPAAGGSNAALLGPWSASGETIDFKPNGQCIYMGQNFGYQISGNTLTLITSQGNVNMNYSLQGNQLTLMANGKSVVFTKGQSGGGAGQQSPGGQRVAQELVGKWCYVNVNSTNTGGSTSEECIELNADGTYVYYSERSMSTNTDAFWAGTNSTSNDQGTWSYDGQRIYYNSQTRGQGSYELVKQNHPRNNDPMIVLDGKAFATHYQKSPW